MIVVKECHDKIEINSITNETTPNSLAEVVERLFCIENIFMQGPVQVKVPNFEPVLAVGNTQKTFDNKRLVKVYSLQELSIDSFIRCWRSRTDFINGCRLFDTIPNIVTKKILTVLPSILNNCAIPGSQTLLYQIARELVLAGTSWQKLAKIFMFDDVFDESTKESLKVLAVEGPGKTRVLAGESWRKIAEELGFIYEINWKSEAIERLQMMVVEGLAKKRVLAGEYWSDVLEDLGFIDAYEFKREASERLQMIIAAGPGLKRVLAGEMWWKVAADYRLIAEKSREYLQMSMVESLGKDLIDEGANWLLVASRYSFDKRGVLDRLQMMTVEGPGKKSVQRGKNWQKVANHYELDCEAAKEYLRKIADECRRSKMYFVRKVFWRAIAWCREEKRFHT